MAVTDRPWTADPDAIARRVDASDVGLLKSLLGGEELEVPEGVVAWVERPDGSIEFPERSDDDKAAADAAFQRLVAQHPGARELCPGVYTVPADATVRDAE